ncbi:MAG: lipopolysaccharide biosynthesis protein [Paludibacteraceae bacterium]|nr:lipopolysaccharide biosynthesis protein [Paludibacteraceae bacterium]
MSDSSLRNTTIKGVGWSFTDSLLNQGTSFLVGIILARLLSPEEYGLLGILLIFIVISESIVNSGLSSALIRKQDTIEQDYNTVFITNLILSFVMYAVLFACAPLISLFFEKPQLTILLRVMGIIVIFNALSIVPYTKLTKDIDFKRITYCSFAGSIVSGIVGITMAITNHGVWSLVGQQMSKQLIYSLLLIISNKWKPQIQFSIKRFKELWEFGWKLLVSGLINTIWNEIYKVVIGKCYTPSTLGQYTQAHLYSDIFSRNLSGIIQRVSYPVLSKMQDDKERMKRAYRLVIKVTMLVSFVFMFGLAGCAKQFIYVLIGEQWLPCVGYLQILCFSMALYPLHSINLNMLQVQGRSDLFLKLEIIKKCIAVLPLLLGIFVDIYWMLGGSVIVGWISYYLNAYYSGPYLNYGVIEQIRDLLPSIALSLGMALIVYLIGYLPLSPYALLPIQIVCGAGIVFLVCEWTHLEEYMQIKQIALTILKRK